MSLCFRTLCAVLLLTVVFSQAPEPNGRGSQSLRPLRPTQRSRSVCRRINCRTLTGQCTSTRNPSWGQARMAQFSYITGSSSENPTGAGLRSARQISNIIFDQDESIPNSRGINQLFVFFGQFLDHNLVATPTQSGDSFDIPVPDGDDKVEEDTLPFTRSVRGEADGGIARRPINTLPSAVDLVAVYGPNQLRNNELQEFDKFGSPTGNLKVSEGNLLPRNTNGFFNAPDGSADFFLAGDHRVNEHPALTALHTLFVREHNYLAEKIRQRIPSLPARQVYEYARKLNIAQYQKIVYEEFYPAIVGSRLPSYRGFRRDTNPTVSDIFAGAAFRVGHTMVDNTIPRQGPSGPITPVPMGELFFRKADTFTEEEFEAVMRGVSNSVAQEVDSKVVNALRNQLFESIPLEEGFDLIALNIQRSRDHALPTFNQIRSIFGLPRLTSFSQISSNPETTDRLEKAYESVDDVEAFPGLLAEDHVPGSSVGPTMAAVWLAEFRRLRDGDQFFYLRIRRALPRLIRRRLRDCVQDLTNSTSLFRQIIIRNTKIIASELPTGDVFRL